MEPRLSEGASINARTNVLRATPINTDSDLGSESSSSEDENDEHSPLLSASQVSSPYSEDLVVSHSNVRSYDQHLLVRSLSHDKRGNIASSVFTLISCMVGGGVLSLPFAFEQAGFILASCILVFALVASTYGGFLVINSKKYCRGKVKNLEDVAKVAFGKPGEVFVLGLLVVVLYLCSVAYFILISDQLIPLIILISGNPHTVWASKLVVLSMVLVVVCPISLRGNLTALRYTSTLSVLCGMFLCVCVMYRSISNDVGGPTTQHDNPVKWYSSSIREILTAVSISELAFSCHFNILPMHSELRNQTRSNKRAILFISMGIAFIVNFAVSFFGYMQFRRFTDQDITKNYAPDDPVVSCGRAALGLMLSLSFPLLMLPCRATLNRLIWHPDRARSRFLLALSNSMVTGPSRVVWFVETVLLVGTSFLLAYLIPQVNMIWGFVGSIGCTIIVYILPPAFYLRVRRHPLRPDLKQISAWCLLVLGALMLMAGMYQSIMNVKEPLREVRGWMDLTEAKNITSG